MKFSITLDEQECKDVFGDVKADHDFIVKVKDREFHCHTAAIGVHGPSGWWSRSGCEVEIQGHGEDKKAQEIAQAKAEVNRTKEAHKEAQRKLSALMEEDNVK